ncbi:MAG: DUF1573 domain-containing protein [Fimbriimonadaceae bacterium]|nr:DUF1573 domain-containing protein [Fimbriimonadaceae bacterium]
MLSALLCLVGMIANPAPTLPAGTSAEFQQLYGSVIQATSERNFAEAKKLSALLPKENIVIQWDDSKVPAHLRNEFAEARDRVFTQWRQFMPQFTMKIGTKPDIKFTFEPKLAPIAGSKEVPAAVHFFGYSPEDPRLEVVIGLERGDPPLPSEATDIHNEVAYGFALYLGLARTPNFGSYTTRAEVPTAILVRPHPGEMNLARMLVEIGDLVKASIAKSEELSWNPPKATIDKMMFDLGTIPQGQIREFSYQLTNIGHGLLMTSMIPDCGCVAQPKVEPIDAGQSRLIHLAVQTADFIGEQHKAILVYTNDPDNPTREIKVRFYVDPAYRFLVPDGEIINVDAKGGTREVFLTVPEGSDIVPEDVRLDGLPAAVTTQAWSGELADPMLNEPKKQRKGYKFTVNIEPGTYVGRNSTTLVVSTKSKTLPVLRQQLSVQSGIVAMPETINLGQISRGPKRASFLVNSAQKDFEILSIESNSPFLTFTHRPVRGKWEHRVTIQYDGKAPDVRIEATIKVKTNDPKTPVVTVLLRALQR